MKKGDKVIISIVDRDNPVLGISMNSYHSKNVKGEIIASRTIYNKKGHIKEIEYAVEVKDRIYWAREEELAKI